MSGLETIRLCNLATLRDRRSLGFEVPLGDNTLQLFLVSDGDGVRGYVDRCPHRGTPLAWQPHRYLDSRGEHLICATHGALFRIGDGYCIAGPCRGARLEPVETKIEKGEILLVVA